jgi:DNA polymerase IV
LSIARIDYDAFYATAEKRDRPARRDQPVIGGGRRGVMAAACYVARTFGIRCAICFRRAVYARMP